MIKVLWFLFFSLVGTQLSLFYLLHQVENKQYKMQSDHDRIVKLEAEIEIIKNDHDRIIQLETEVKELAYGR